MPANPPLIQGSSVFQLRAGLPHFSFVARTPYSRVACALMAHHPHPSPEHQLELAIETLRANGQRVTGPRKAILTMLIAEHGPFSAEEIFRKLPHGECDLV